MNGENYKVSPGDCCSVYPLSCDYHTWISKHKKENFLVFLFKVWEIYKNIEHKSSIQHKMFSIKIGKNLVKIEYIYVEFCWVFCTFLINNMAG